VGPDHDQAMPAKRPGLRALTSKRRDSSGGAERRPPVRPLTGFVDPLRL